MTFKFFTPFLLLPLFFFTGCPEEPKACSYNPCAPGCPVIPSCEDDPVDAGPNLQVDCAQVDNIAKNFGGSSGPCGPINFITVNEAGSVVESIGAANPPEGETECGEPTVTHYLASPANARALIDTVCEDYNSNYVPPGQLDLGTYTNWVLLQGNTELGKTEINLSVSSNALDSFMVGLTPNNPPTESSDAGVALPGVDGGQ